MNIKSINFRSVAEISTVGLFTALTFYIAKAGATLGTASWLPLPEFNHSDYGLSTVSALAWNNMLAMVLALMLLVAYVSDWLCRDDIWREYHTQRAPSRHKQPWFRALHTTVGVASFIVAGGYLQAYIPDPESAIPASVFFDGVLIRALGVVTLYVGLRFIPYLFVREFCRVTGKLVTDQ